MPETQLIPQPRKAEKKRVKIKAGVQGPSGSGKTWGALALSFNLWPSAKVCVIDSENESASLYADHWEFDTIPLTPPFTSARYQECIQMVVRLGYDVAIIDSISHQWDGEGGILRRKEALDQRPGANSWVMKQNAIVEPLILSFSFTATNFCPFRSIDSVFNG